MIGTIGTRELLVTTSWDDGSVEDARLVDHLTRHGIRGTLYVPRAHPERAVIDDRRLRDLAGAPGIEIGSHTVSHRPLTELRRSEVTRELRDSRRDLEDLLGRDVRSFCFPYGKHRPWMRTAVARAGYRVGRTTLSHRVDRAFDPLLMPTTVQFYPHGRTSYLRHAVKERNLTGLAGLARTRTWAPTAVDSVLAAAELARRRGGVLHVWGHSWEIAAAGAWAELDEVLAMIRSWPEATLVTNAELGAAVGPAR